MPRQTCPVCLARYMTGKGLRCEFLCPDCQTEKDRLIEELMARMPDAFEDDTLAMAHIAIELALIQRRGTDAQSEEKT